MGYVGLPLAVAFSKKFKTVGLDKSSTKINSLKNNIDTSKLISNKILKKRKKLIFSKDYNFLTKSKFIIVCVPTPINKKNKPNLRLLKNACKIIGKKILKKTTIVFESTVYPGVTEEVCIPIIEKNSKLKWKKDFNVGYSPERVSPGEKSRDITQIKKIVSGDNSNSLKSIKNLYSSIIKPGIHDVKSIKIAEAAKILENIQRDTNIALMNEISIIFDKLNINTIDVINAASSKWNFNKYYPGLVGGHCIGVDPYYLVYKAKKVGYIPDIINSARRINNFMSEFVINKVCNFLKLKNLHSKKILILGITFKENCNDIRNSRIYDIAMGLKKKKIQTFIHDPLANKKEVYNQYKIKLVNLENIKFKLDGIILAVAHKRYNKVLLKKLIKKIKNKGFFFDIKSNYKHPINKKITVWKL